MGDPHRQPRRVVWTREETIDLLVNLDIFVRANRTRGKVHRDNLIRYLRRSSKRRNKQIEGKLQSIWRQWGGAPGSRGIERLLEYGISSLKDLPSDIRCEIEDSRKARELSSPRQLRSKGLLSEEYRTTKDRVRATSSVENTPTRAIRIARSRSTRSTTYQHDWTENPSFRMRTNESSTPTTQVPGALNDLQQTSRSIAATRSSESLSDVEDNSRAIDSHDRSSDRGGQNNGVKREIDQAHCFLADLPVMPIFDYNRPEPVQQFYESSILSSDQELFQGLWRDNTYLREEVEGLKFENERLEKAARFLESQDPQGRIDQTIRRNLILSEQVRIQGMFGPRDAQGTALAYPTIGRIRHLFDKMKSKCAVASRNPTYRYPEELSFMERGDTKMLIDAAIQNNGPSSSLFATRSQLVARVSPAQLVHCLIGIAIQEWVFKPSLRCITMLSTPLLDQYRKLIRALGVAGETALQTVEFEAHQLLITAPSFEDTYLLATAQQYVDQLLDVVRPLLVETAEWGEVDVQQQLQSAFQNALRIKLQTICCKDLFDTIWPDPGSRIQRSLVVTEREAQLQNSSLVSERESLSVELTLVPGIRRYAWNCELVDYCSFSIDGKEGLGQPETVCEAVVVVVEE